MENVHDYVLTSKSKDDKRDMLQPRAQRITSWLFDATSYKIFVAFDKPKILDVCHLPCRIHLTNCTKIEVDIWTEALNTLN